MNPQKGQDKEDTKERNRTRRSGNARIPFAPSTGLFVAGAIAGAWSKRASTRLRGLAPVGAVQFGGIASPPFSASSPTKSIAARRPFGARCESRRTAPIRSRRSRSDSSPHCSSPWPCRCSAPSRRLDVRHRRPDAACRRRARLLGRARLSLAFVGLASLLSLRFGGELGTKAVAALAAGGVVGRLAHVAVNWNGFSAEPERILMVWQGGFALWPGVLAAIATLFVTLRSKSRRAASIAALAAGLFAWNVAVQLVATTSAVAAPTTQMATLDGRSISLGDFKGKPLVVNLWATWCPPCRREMPMMTTVAASRDDVAFVFANQGEGAGSIARFFAQADLSPTHVALDPTMALARHYSVEGYPATLFIGADGVLQDMHFGEISREGLQAAIEELKR